MLNVDHGVAVAQYGYAVDSNAQSDALRAHYENEIACLDARMIELQEQRLQQNQTMMVKLREALAEVSMYPADAQKPMVRQVLATHTRQADYLQKEIQRLERAKYNSVMRAEELQLITHEQYLTVVNPETLKRVHEQRNELSKNLAAEMETRNKIRAEENIQQKLIEEMNLGQSLDSIVDLLVESNIKESILALQVY